MLPQFDNAEETAKEYPGKPMTFVGPFAAGEGVLSGEVSTSEN